MSAALAFWLAQADDDLGGLILFVLFFVVPLVLRILRWLGQRAGLVRPEAEEGAEDPREVLRRRRAERQAAEEEGEELWKRLARGEVPEPPEPPAPRPVAVPEPAREVSLEWELAPEPGEVAAESLEREEEPVPLATLGEVREVPAASEASLETEAEPLPLGALDASHPPAEERARRSPARSFAALARDDWQRAIVLSEVLGPPVSERMPA